MSITAVPISMRLVFALTAARQRKGEASSAYEVMNAKIGAVRAQFLGGNGAFGSRVQRTAHDRRKPRMNRLQFPDVFNHLEVEMSWIRLALCFGKLVDELRKGAFQNHAIVVTNGPSQDGFRE